MTAITRKKDLRIRKYVNRGKKRKLVTWLAKAVAASPSLRATAQVKYPLTASALRSIVRDVTRIIRSLKRRQKLSCVLNASRAKSSGQISARLKIPLDLSKSDYNDVKESAEAEECWQIAQGVALKRNVFRAITGLVSTLSPFHLSSKTESGQPSKHRVPLSESKERLNDRFPKEVWKDKAEKAGEGSYRTSNTCGLSREFPIPRRRHRNRVDTRIPHHSRASRNLPPLGGPERHSHSNTQAYLGALNSTRSKMSSTPLSDTSKSLDHHVGFGADDAEWSYVQYDPEKEAQYLPAMRELISRDLSEPYSIYVYRYFLYAWPELCYLCIKKSGQLLGVIINKMEPHVPPSQTNKPEDPEHPFLNRGYIAMLATHTSYRRRGIASELVKLAVQAMIDKGADEVALETEVDNAPSLKLYGRIGFIRSKRLYRYYLNGKEAFRLMLKTSDRGNAVQMAVTSEQQKKLRGKSASESGVEASFADLLQSLQEDY